VFSDDAGSKSDLAQQVRPSSSLVLRGSVRGRSGFLLGAAPALHPRPNHGNILNRAHPA
jgi:hypothetical protein